VGQYSEEEAAVRNQLEDAAPWFSSSAAATHAAIQQLPLH
jgi:hypothetical protein